MRQTYELTQNKMVHEYISQCKQRKYIELINQFLSFSFVVCKPN